MLDLFDELISDAVDGLGLTGLVSDRQLPWILRLFVAVLAVVLVLIVVAAVMVLTGNA
jgi:hypothetical protein